MNIKELAEQVGLAYKTADGHYWIDAGYVDVHLERFAELIIEQERKEAAKHHLKFIRECVEQEREACAKVCEGYQFDYAKAIRARRET